MRIIPLIKEAKPMMKKLAALLLVLMLSLGAVSAMAEGESHLQRVLDSGVLPCR